MAFGGFDVSAAPRPVSEINMIPLIDVMLVLLIIFIVTAPLMTHAVRLDLPKVSTVATSDRETPVEIGIDALGRRSWNGEPVDRQGLRARLAAAATQSPTPPIRLRADRNARYEAVAQTVGDAANAGLPRIAFVSEPEDAPAR